MTLSAFLPLVTLFAPVLLPATGGGIGPDEASDPGPGQAGYALGLGANGAAPALGAQEESGVPEPLAVEAGDDESESRDQLRLSWLGEGAGELWSPHLFNYAALGPDDLKMQVSYKYRLLREDSFYMAFTSMIMWDIYDDSIPFRDITFQPEIFYRVSVDESGPYSLDFGYWHNSNGDDGPTSRAWDRWYARGILNGELLDREILVVPTVYVTFNEAGENADISDYMGDWELNVMWRSLIDPEGDDLDLLMNIFAGRNNVPFDRGQFQLALRYRIPNVTFNPRLFLQFFSGYGDTMLEYNEKNTTVRLGIAF